MKKAGYEHYERNGVRYLSVTTALKIINKPALNEWRVNMGKEASEKIAEAGREFGKEFHRYCEMIDKGEGWDIDVKKLGSPMKEFVEKFRDWFYANVEEVLATEKEVYSEKYLYAGRFDRLYKIKGVKKPVICDVKTGNFTDKLDSWQLAAYKGACIEDLQIQVGDRMLLYFNKKKISFDPIWLPPENYDGDFNSFILAVQLWYRYNKS